MHYISISSREYAVYTLEMYTVSNIGSVSKERAVGPTPS